MRQRKTKNDQELTLDEEDEMEEDSDDSLGEDAVDLATMLDNYEDSGDEKPAVRGKKRHTEEAFDGFSNESDQEDDGPSDISLSDAEGETEDPQQLRRLQDLISSMTPAEEAAERKRKGYDALEASAPSDSATIGSGKIDLADLIPATAGSKLRQAAKILRDDVKASKRNGIPAKVEVPLPKRQQDKLDRIAANKKTKETLERWTDTVQRNRQAEHLSFPLKHGDETELEGSRRFLPTTKPQNDLESNIQNILLQSGLMKQNGQTDEDKIRQFEELETKKLPQEEVEARRAELRKARELLFREEVRAKRIKKIKSKSYRRVHRKERERLEQKERAMLEAERVDLEEEERELNDRRRAEERMGAKHRESKWAKGVKKSGKAAWDDDARDGVTEMARRNEELRKRMSGKDVRNENEADSDVSSGDDESEVEDEEERQARKIGRQLQRVSAQDVPDGPGSKLANMAFM
ncbi:Utp14-domain-containing protein, partial [Pseudovirgaria hyperparasitica]